MFFKTKRFGNNFNITIGMLQLFVIPTERSDEGSHILANRDTSLRSV